MCAVILLTAEVQILKEFKLFVWRLKCSLSVGYVKMIRRKGMSENLTMKRYSQELRQDHARSMITRAISANVFNILFVGILGIVKTNYK